MSNKVLLLENGNPVTAAGSANGQVLTWDNDTQTASFEAGGAGTVTSVGLTGGTSGIMVGGSASPITNTGTFDLNAPLRFAFNTATPTAPVLAGQVAWNDTEGALESMLKGDNVSAILGEQVYQRVVNADSETLTKGMVVYVFGSSGTRISVKRALADADPTSAAILGVVAESIAVNSTGFVMTSGLMKGLSVLPTSGFTDGAVVYLSPTTPGGLTTTKTTAPQHLVTVGYVAKTSNGSAGELLVHPQNGYELDELHDVYVNSPTSGQILVYDATSGQTRWENASLGSSNGVAVTAGAGSLSVGLDAASSPTLTGLTLSGLTNGLVRSTSGVLSGGATVSLTSEVSGVLPVARGGTNMSSYATGDMIYASGSLSLARLAAGTSGQALQSGGAGAPSWVGYPYDLGAASVGTYTNSQVIFRHIAVRSVTITSAGSLFRSLAAPSGPVTVNVQKNGVTAFSVTFSVAGGTTGSLPSPTTVTLAAGDVLTVVTPQTPDTTLASVYFTLKATALGN